MATGQRCGQRHAVTLDANTPFLEKDFIITARTAARASAASRSTSSPSTTTTRGA
jgi:hypothetical protein